MNQIAKSLASLAACAVLSLPNSASAQPAPAIPAAITTPDKVETRIGTLEFKDGAPSKATLDKVYDHLDFTYAFRAFVDTRTGGGRDQEESHRGDSARDLVGAARQDSVSDRAGGRRSDRAARER
jgi:hypothetical protein